MSWEFPSTTKVRVKCLLVSFHVSGPVRKFQCAVVVVYEVYEGGTRHVEVHGNEYSTGMGPGTRGTGTDREGL